MPFMVMAVVESHELFENGNVFADRESRKWV
jgi:hypothetical protein